METKQLILLISLFFCHWLGDYTHLSANWMLNAKKLGRPLFPIFTHACVQGYLMWFPLIFIGHSIKRELILLSLQIITHFIFDTLKGRINLWCPSVTNTMNRSHWYIMGIDQFFHSTVIIFIVYYFI